MAAGNAVTNAAVERGRAARRAWTDAFTDLAAADRERPLAAKDLERLAIAAFLIGRVPESTAAWERAHQEAGARTIPARHGLAPRERFVELAEPRRSRVGRLVLLGAGMLLESIGIPAILRVRASPRVSAGRDTDAMRSERDMPRRALGPRMRTDVAFGEHELARISHPTLFVLGTADPVAPLAFAQRVVDLLPHGALHVARRVLRFLEDEAS